MADRDALTHDLGDGWTLVLTGVRREATGERAIVADALLKNGRVAVSDPVVLSTREGRQQWAATATGPERPTADVLEQGFLALVEEAAALLQDPPARESQADRLVQLADVADYFHDAYDKTFARVPVGDHHETHPLHGKGFRSWLARQYYAAHGKAPGAQAMQDALGVLDGRALYDGDTRPVFVRVGEHAGRIYLDLGDPDWRAVEIDAGGWRVVTSPPVAFRRPAGLLPLPEPVPGGSLAPLRALLNVSDADWVLVVGWLVQALRPCGPYPVLSIGGEQGAAKTTIARLVRSLIDPHRAAVRGEPREVRDLMVAATNGWVQLIDNASFLPAWLSDALCRLSTGGALSTRQLYSDDGETLLDAQRPTIINGITDLATRPDLLDRCLVVAAPVIDDADRRPEAEINAAFAAAHPVALGALLSAVSGALARVHAVRLPSLPRMADFAVWVSAAEPELGWEPGTFLATYQENRALANAVLRDADPLAVALLDFLPVGERWEGTAADLLAELNDTLDDDRRRSLEQAKAWPRTPRALSGALRRLAPVLRSDGLRVDFRRSRGERDIHLERVGIPPAPPSPPSPPPVPNGEKPHAVQENGPVTDEKSGDGRGDGWVTVGAQTRATVTPTVTPPNGEKPHAVQENGPAGDGGDGGDGRIHPYSSGVAFVTDAADLAPALARLPDRVIGFDLETTGLDPLTDRVRLLQLAGADAVVVIDADQVPPAAWGPAVAPLFADRVIATHNGSFDLGFLLRAGVPLPARVLDTLLAAQLLDQGAHSGVRGFFTLAAVADRVLGETLDKAEQAGDWTGPLTDAQIAYAARDAAVTRRLALALAEALEQAGLQGVARLEFAALPAVAWLETTGAPFDAAAWLRLSDAAVAEQVRLEAAIAAAAGLAQQSFTGRAALNLDSPQQVRALLARLGVAVPDTDAGTLATVQDAHPVVPLLLAYREASKRAATYGVAFVARHVHPADGRVHTHYRQIGAATGRMSSTGPNLQNIPRDPAYRACFRPEPGRVLVKADYSAIELRLAAAIAGDTALQRVFRDGGDPHRQTAALVLGKDPADVTKEDRQLAKALGFGLLYGMGSATFAQHARENYGLNLSLAEAGRLRERFFTAYPGLRAWHRAQPDGETVVTTPAGRQRVVRRFTEKLNSPVQGAGADGLKAALGILWATRDRVPSAAPVLVVHDEIVIECDAAEAAAARAWLVAAMETGMRPYLGDIPPAVEATVCADWSGAPITNERSAS